jgi:hypothetical protein
MIIIELALVKDNSYLDVNSINISNKSNDKNHFSIPEFSVICFLLK